jgi:RNA-binding motif X-linked protein 2
MKSSRQSLPFTADDGTSESDSSSRAFIDPEDPMRDYLLLKREEEKSSKKTKKVKSKSKHKGETPEERRQRKERKREKKARKQSANKSSAMKDVEALLSMLDKRATDNRPRSRSRSLDKRKKRPRSPGPDHEIHDKQHSGSRNTSMADGGYKKWDRQIGT